MREVSKRVQLTKLLEARDGGMKLSDLAYVSKVNGNITLTINIAGKELTYHINSGKYDVVALEIEQTIQHCLEEYARRATAELFWK